MINLLFLCARNRLRSPTAVICLDIPDDYAFMQPELVALLEKKVARFLPHSK